ncbi:MAG: hypothetical protein U0T77_03515 [Chitinophagales bacterium]
MDGIYHPTKENQIKCRLCGAAGFTIALLCFIFGSAFSRHRESTGSPFAFKTALLYQLCILDKGSADADEFDRLDIFKGSTTMLQCLLANPLMFAKHVGTNILNYGLGMFGIRKTFYYRLYFIILAKEKHILHLLLNGHILYLIFRKKTYRNVLPFIQQHTTISIIIGDGGWSYFAIFFVFPERHYIILHFFWWTGLLTFILKEQTLWLNNKFVFYSGAVIGRTFNPDCQIHPLLSQYAD